MSSGSAIEWTQATWNPVSGCKIVSPGCTNCYAMRLAHRLSATGMKKYQGLTRTTGGRPKWNGTVRTHAEALDLPLRWRKPRTVFVNSMSDLLHEDVPDAFIRRVFAVMERTPQHIYQTLTKRAERLRPLGKAIPKWPDNMWMGVSVENDAWRGRIDALREAREAAVRFLSLEPLLGPLPALDLQGIDWVIVGGESGPGARPMEEKWALDLRDQCVAAGVAFFFKQWGGRRGPKTGGRELDGRTWDEFPEPRVVA